jgi:hypothetical protein
MLNKFEETVIRDSCVMLLKKKTEMGMKLKRSVGDAQYIRNMTWKRKQFYLFVKIENSQFGCGFFNQANF